MSTSIYLLPFVASHIAHRALAVTAIRSTHFCSSLAAVVAMHYSPDTGRDWRLCGTATVTDIATNDACSTGVAHSVSVRTYSSIGTEQNPASRCLRVATFVDGILQAQGCSPSRRRPGDGCLGCTVAPSFVPFHPSDSPMATPAFLARQPELTSVRSPLFDGR